MDCGGRHAAFCVLRESNVLGILDLDVSPSVCIEEAELGTFEELIE